MLTTNVDNIHQKIIKNFFGQITKFPTIFNPTKENCLVITSEWLFLPSHQIVFLLVDFFQKEKKTLKKWFWRFWIPRNEAKVIKKKFGIHLGMNNIPKTKQNKPIKTNPTFESWNGNNTCKCILSIYIIWLSRITYNHASLNYDKSCVYTCVMNLLQYS